jgi:hypothetical protein
MAGWEDGLEDREAAGQHQSFCNDPGGKGQGLCCGAGLWAKVEGDTMCELGATQEVQPGDLEMD